MTVFGAQSDSALFKLIRVSVPMLLAQLISFPYENVGCGKTPWSEQDPPPLQIRNSHLWSARASNASGAIVPLDPEKSVRRILRWPSYFAE